MSSSTSVKSGMPASPGDRMCCLFVPKDRPVPWFFPVLISAIVEVDEIKHKYGFGGGKSLVNLPFNSEKLGFIYTCAAGLIDLGHLGDTIDLTWDAYRRLLRSPSGGGEFVLDDKGSVITLKSVPTDAPTLINLAGSIAYDMAVRHEIESYFVHTPGEHNSSFSPEDLVSNFLGAYIAGLAITAILPPVGGDFDEAATTAAKDVLKLLGAQDKTGTQAAFDKIEGLWFSPGRPTNDDYLKRRNFNYSPIVPWTYGIASCIGAEIWPASIPQQFDAQIQSYYEITFGTNYADADVAKNVQAGVGGTTFKNTDFPVVIQRIAADSKSHGESDQPN